MDPNQEPCDENDIEEVIDCQEEDDHDDGALAESDMEDEGLSKKKHIFLLLFDILSYLINFQILKVLQI